MEIIALILSAVSIIVAIACGVIAYIQNMKINQPTLNAPAGDTPNGTDGTWNDVGIIS